MSYSHNPIAINKCPVCGTAQRLKYRLKYDVYQCASCGLQTSTAGFNHSFSSSLDAEARDKGINQLRIRNFKKIIQALKKAAPACRHGLEIGSGNGWWLEICEKEGINCEGIEPEERFREVHQKNNLSVHYGFYPLPGIGDKKYDFIIFNDVFEHIPQLENLMASLSANTADNGLLIINLPMRNGFFYRVAAGLYHIGISSFLERMWQFNFHSPHINYFTPSNLEKLLHKSGYAVMQQMPLDTLDYSSIRERVAADSSNSRLRTAALSLLLLLARPIVQYSSPDIRVFFFRRSNDGE